MHEGVKQEIIEDGALGKKVKESGYKMKMVRGEHLIEAVWARDKSTLWNALKRLMVPLIHSKWKNSNWDFLCSSIFVVCAISNICNICSLFQLIPYLQRYFVLLQQ